MWRTVDTFGGMPSRPPLVLLSALLGEHHPEIPRPVSKDPFHLVLWEQVAYLATDDVRLSAFTALNKRVGLTAAKIKAAPLGTLRSIARMGGSIAVNERADRIRTSAELSSTLKGLGDLPVEEARKRLIAFPMIGAPGADLILMLMGRRGVFALESNGLRVLLRIGFGKESSNYAASYRSVLGDLARELPDGAEARIALHQRLRSHGLLLCKRSKPLCATCSIRSYCRHAHREG